MGQEIKLLILSNVPLLSKFMAVLAFLLNFKVKNCYGFGLSQSVKFVGSYTN